jgi:hypothetical protein
VALSMMPFPWDSNGVLGAHSLLRARSTPRATHTPEERNPFLSLDLADSARLCVSGGGILQCSPRVYVPSKTITPRHPPEESTATTGPS